MKYNDVHKVLDKVSLRLRNSTTVSKDENRAGQEAILMIAKELKLEQCHKCNRFFKQVGQHIVTHYTFYEN